MDRGLQRGHLIGEDQGGDLRLGRGLGLCRRVKGRDRLWAGYKVGGHGTLERAGGIVPDRNGLRRNGCHGARRLLSKSGGCASFGSFWRQLRAVEGRYRVLSRAVRRD